MPSQFSYAGIALDVNRIASSRDAIYDGTNYLYTRFHFRVQGVYNPAATAYTLGPILAQPGQNVMAPTTDVAIREQLMRPRQRLVYTIAPGSVVLESPWTDPKLAVTMDDNNGPRPIGVPVVVPHGVKTFLVDFSVQTDVNEKRNLARFGTQPLILSHTFGQTEDLDEHFFATRTTTGKMIFSTWMMEAIRNGVVARGGGQPDSARTYIAKNFVPVPANCQREAIHVEVDEEDNAIHYNFVDRERALNIVFKNVTEIQARQTYSGSPSAAVDQAGNAAIQIGGGAAIGMIIGGGPASPFGWLGAGIGAGAGWFFGDWDKAGGSVPVISHGMEIDVYGNRNANRKQLFAAGLKVIRARFGLMRLAEIAIGTSKGSVDFDLMGKHCHISLNFTGGATGNLLEIGRNFFIAIDADRLFQDKDDIDDGANRVAVSRAQANPAPPGDGFSRGTLAQALQSLGPV